MILNRPLYTAVLGSAGILLASVALVPLAKEPSAPPPPNVPAFDAIDKDNDGNITTAEAQGTWLADAFAKADVNHDGHVTKVEYEQATS